MMPGTLRYVRALGPIDGRTVWRDPLLRWTLAFPLLIALGLRLGGPQLVERLGDAIGYDLAPHYVPLLGFALLAMVPMLVGTVVGFVLLDQRDDDTLSALRVTPMPLGVYLAYRLAAPLALSTALAAVLLPVAGLGGVGAGGAVLAALGAAPLAPLFALAFAAFAANKVQGFALMKLSGLLAFPPLAAYFIAPPWHWAFGLAPTFWPGKVYWTLLAGEAGAFGYLAVGLFFQAMICAGLLRLLRRRLGG